MPEEIQFLWRQSATITPLSGSDLQVGERGPESTDSEREREREMIEVPEREVWKSILLCGQRLAGMSVKAFNAGDGKTLTVVNSLLVSLREAGPQRNGRNRDA